MQENTWLRSMQPSTLQTSSETAPCHRVNAIERQARIMEEEMMRSSSEGRYAHLVANGVPVPLEKSLFDVISSDAAFTDQHLVVHMWVNGTSGRVNMGNNSSATVFVPAHTSLEIRAHGGHGTMDATGMEWGDSVNGLCWFTLAEGAKLLLLNLILNNSSTGAGVLCTNSWSWKSTTPAPHRIHLEGSSFSNHHSNGVARIKNATGTIMIMKHCHFSDNFGKESSSMPNGGALYIGTAINSTISMAGCTFSNNSAAGVSCSKAVGCGPRRMQGCGFSACVA